MPKPNILLLVADELRPDALGCYGNRVCRTPNLDRLAGRAIVFQNAFTPNPICVPARAAITTGNYPHVATGIKANSGRIRDDQVKLAGHFAAAGYETYACGKLHYVPYSPPGVPRLVHGFQHVELTESGRIVGDFCRTGPGGIGLAEPAAAPIAGRSALPSPPRGLEDYIDYLADVGWSGYSRAHGVGNNDVRPCPTPLPAEHHVDHWVADCTIRRIREHAPNGAVGRARAGRPFLIHCGFPKPHEPLDPPAEFVALYDPRDIPPPAGHEGLLAGRNPYLQRDRLTHALDSLSPAARQVVKAYYYALITFQDQQIGRILSALEETGQADNTIVVFTADHGDLMGDFGCYFKCVFLEGSVRVPLIVSAPGVAGGRRGQLAGLQDILPTLAAMTGCPLPREVQGLDLSPALRDAAATGRKLYYAQCLDEPRQSAMVCDGRWKYCYAQEGPTEELYDLAADPRELVNLAAAAAGQALLPAWRERLAAEARRLGDASMLRGEGGSRLVESPLTPIDPRKLPVSGMGWRWY